MENKNAFEENWNSAVTALRFGVELSAERDALRARERLFGKTAKRNC